MSSERDRSRSPIQKVFNEDKRGNNQRGRKDRKDNKNSRRYEGRTPSKKQVFVANIPFNMSWQVVKDLFRDKIGEDSVGFVKMFVDDRGRSKGSGIIEFKDPSGVTRALEEMHQFEIDGRKLVVKEDFEVERDEHGNPTRPRPINSNRVASNNGSRRQRNRSPERYRGNRDDWGRDQVYQPDVIDPPFDTMGLSIEFLDSLGIKGPLINRVFVSNIDYSVTQPKLEEVFALAGKIESMDFMTDNDGKSRGRAVVEFSHPVEAVQAISMFNQQKLYDRILSVDMDRHEKNVPPIDNLPSGLKGIGRGLGANGLPLNLMNSGEGPFNVDDVPPAPAALPVIDKNIDSSGPSSVGNSGSIHPALAQLTQQQLLSLISSGILSGVGNTDPGSVPIAGPVKREHLPSSNPTGVVGLGGIGKKIYNSHSLPANQSSMYADSIERRYSQNESLPHSNKSDTIIVRNLSSSSIWEGLRDKFCDVGDVHFAEIRTPGCGIVKFGSSRDAERAVNLMNGTWMEGRTISVQLHDISR